MKPETIIRRYSKCPIPLPPPYDCGKSLRFGYSLFGPMHINQIQIELRSLTDKEIKDEFEINYKGETC